MLIMYCPRPSHSVDYKEVRVQNISTIAFRRRNSALNVDNGARESASAVLDVESDCVSKHQR